MKKILGLAAGLLLGTAVLPATAQNVVSDKPDGHEVVVSVQGMFCENCAYAVEKRVGKLKGVGSVDVHLSEQEVRVTVVPGEIVEDDALRDAILDAGFRPVAVHHRDSGANSRGPNAEDRSRSDSNSVDVHRR